MNNERAELNEAERVHIIGVIRKHCSDRLADHVAALLAADAQAGEWHDEKPDEWTDQINAAHPLKTKNYKAWDTAMQMVGNRRKKHALVELVCWLLQRADAQAGGEAVVRLVVPESRTGLITGTTEAAHRLPPGEYLCYIHPQPQAVPHGWKLVPVEPTDAMAVAAIKASLRNPAINGVAIYRAMLSTSPAAPQEDLPAILKRQAS